MILARRIERVDGAQRAQRRAADAERRAVIGQRLDAAVHEHAAGFDAAPPRQRLEVVLRLDHFVRFEQLAERQKRSLPITDVAVRDDDVLARGEVGRGTERVERTVRSAVLRPRRQVPADPAQRAAVALEQRQRRAVEHDHVAVDDAQSREVTGKTAQIARPQRLLLDHDQVRTPVIPWVAVSHTPRKSNPGAEISGARVRHDNCRVCWREGVARLSRMRALPGIPVADAHLAQRVTARPEAYTGCVRVGIEVSDQYQVQTPSASALLYDPRSGHRLQLALMLEVHLPIGKMVDEQQRTNRVWRQDLRDKRSTGEVPRSGCHV